MQAKHISQSELLPGDTLAMIYVPIGRIEYIVHVTGPADDNGHIPITYFAWCPVSPGDVYHSTSRLTGDSLSHRLVLIRRPKTNAS